MYDHLRMHDVKTKNITSNYKNATILYSKTVINNRLRMHIVKSTFFSSDDLPFIFEVVIDMKLVKDKPTANSESKSRGSAKVSVFLF